MNAIGPTRGFFIEQRIAPLGVIFSAHLGACREHDHTARTGSNHMSLYCSPTKISTHQGSIFLLRLFLTIIIAPDSVCLHDADQSLASLKRKFTQ